MPSVAIVYFSAQGHTHQVAEAVAEGARAVADTAVGLHRLVGSDIHEGRWKNDAVMAALKAADAIVFGTPTYMGGYSAQMKAFIDAASAAWMKLEWKDKVGAAFTHSQGLSGDKLNTLFGLAVNAMQHGMLWVGTGVLPPPAGATPDKLNRLSSFSGAMAQTDYGQEQVNPGDLDTARVLGRRVAEVTARWVKGRP